MTVVVLSVVVAMFVLVVLLVVVAVVVVVVLMNVMVAVVSVVLVVATVLVVSLSLEVEPWFSSIDLVWIYFVQFDDVLIIRTHVRTDGRKKRCTEPGSLAIYTLSFWWPLVHFAFSHLTFSVC